MAGIFTNPCEILILDEPTNHIDSDTVEWLEGYLKKFRGAIFMVTHDRYFLDRVTNVILELTGGKLYRHEETTSISGESGRRVRKWRLPQNASGGPCIAESWSGCAAARRPGRRRLRGE